MCCIDPLRPPRIAVIYPRVEIRADLSDIGWMAVKISGNWHPAMANQSGFDGASYEQLIEARQACPGIRAPQPLPLAGTDAQPSMENRK